MLLSLAACGGNTEDTSTVDAVETGAVTLAKTEEVFEAGTEVKVETVTAGDIYQKAQAAIKPVAKNFAVYEFNAVKDTTKVQPNGKLAVTFAVPDTFGTENLAVYYVDDVGKRERLAATVDAATRTVVAELEHFSTYVLVELAPEAVNVDMMPTTAPTTAGDDTTTTVGEETTTVADTTVTTTVPTVIIGMTTTAKPTATTTKKPTTTTTKKPTTTTTKALTSALKATWEGTRLDGNMLYVYEIDFAQNAYIMQGGSPALDMFGSQEEVDKYYKENPEEFYTYKGEKYLFGLGDGGEIKAVEDGKTVTLTGEDGKTAVLTRMDENTLKVTAQNGEFFSFKVGDVFTKK